MSFYMNSVKFMKNSVKFMKNNDILEKFIKILVKKCNN
jgi:hypothetical protein